MVSHYVLYEQTPEKNAIYLAEFEQLEMALDFVELYHRKIPEKTLFVRGVSYRQSGLVEGKVIASWDPIPEELTDGYSW